MMEVRTVSTTVISTVYVTTETARYDARVQRENGTVTSVQAMVNRLAEGPAGGDTAEQVGQLMWDRGTLRVGTGGLPATDEAPLYISEFLGFVGSLGDAVEGAGS